MNDKNKKAFERAKEKLKKIALVGAVAAPLFAGGKANAQSVTQDPKNNRDITVTQNKDAIRIHNVVNSFTKKTGLEYMAFETEGGHVQDWSGEYGSVNLLEAKDGSSSEYRFITFNECFYCDAQSGKAFTYNQNEEKVPMSSEELNKKLDKFEKYNQLKANTYVMESKDYSR